MFLLRLLSPTSSDQLNWSDRALSIMSDFCVFPDYIDENRVVNFQFFQYMTVEMRKKWTALVRYRVATSSSRKSGKFIKKCRRKRKQELKKREKNGNVRFGRFFEFCIVLWCRCRCGWREFLAPQALCDFYRFRLI